jgi:hypothetical protein
MSTTDAFEAEVARLTKRLMRKFDKRHHRFLVDYGWQDVARVALRGRVFRKRRAGR